MKLGSLLFLIFASGQVEAFFCTTIFANRDPVTLLRMIDSGKGQTVGRLFERATPSLDSSVMTQYRLDQQRAGRFDIDRSKQLAQRYTIQPNRRNFEAFFRSLEGTVLLALRPFLHRIDIDTYFDLYQEISIQLSRRIERRLTNPAQLETFFVGLIQHLERGPEIYLRNQIEEVRSEINDRDRSARLWLEGIRLRDVAALAFEIGIAFEQGLALIQQFTPRSELTEVASLFHNKPVFDFAELLNRLEPEEQKVILGIHVMQHSLQEMAQSMSRTRERIRQIELKAARKLRRWARGDSFESASEEAPRRSYQ